MRDPVLLAIHRFVTVAKLLRPGGIGAVAAESMLLKQQLMVSNRCRRRVPKLTTSDRIVLGLISRFVYPRRIPKHSAIVKPAILLKFQQALVDCKPCLHLSSFGRPRKPGSQGPSSELIAAILEMKRRDP